MLRGKEGKGKGGVFTSKIKDSSWGSSLFTTKEKDSFLSQPGPALATGPTGRKSRGVFVTKEEAMRAVGIMGEAIWQDVED